MSKFVIFIAVVLIGVAHMRPLCYQFDTSVVENYLKADRLESPEYLKQSKSY